MSAVCNTPADLSDIASKDTERIVGRVAECLAANSPFINVLDGGTFESGISDVQKSVIQMPAAPGDSLAIPTFTNSTDLCGTQGLQDLTGTTEFTYRLEGKRGRGPRVCVKKGYSAFRSSYLAAEDSLSKLVTQYINADVQAQLYLRSGSKFTIKTGHCFDDLFTGGEFTDYNTTDFAPVLPDAPLSFKSLQKLVRHFKEVLWADMFPADGKGQAHYKFIGSADIIDSLRNEAGVEGVMIGLASGGYRLGENTLTAYSWETSPAYRGVAFGSTQTPLRATGFNADGTLALVNPRLTVTDAATNTAYSVVNPAWLSAPYEVAFLIAQNSFKRLVPEKYTGEGSFKFAPQLHMGELQWHYQIDNDCNIFGDYGWHIYQIERAYEPVRPHHVCPILYKRCEADLDLTECVVSTCAPIVSVL